MKITYPEIHDALMTLPMGKSLVYEALDSRTLTNIRGEITYFFQGTLKEHDNRLNDPNFSHDLSWNWRIEDSYTRNEQNTRVWDLVLTKVPTPDQWKFSGVERKLHTEKQQLEDRLSEITVALDTIQIEKLSPKK